LGDLGVGVTSALLRLVGTVLEGRTTSGRRDGATSVRSRWTSWPSQAKSEVVQALLELQTA